jgi:hypothetical protein
MRPSITPPTRCSAEGLMRGQRVELLSHNNDPQVIVYFALARLGDPTAPLDKTAADSQ